MKNTLFIIYLLLTCTIGYSQSYCTPRFYYASSGCSTGHVIDSFKLVGVSSSINDVMHCSGTSYEDRTSLSCNLMPGGTYTATMNICGLGTTNMNYQIWIDFNNDGTFQSTETVVGANSVIGNVNPTFTIPVTLSTGSYRMRVEIEYLYHSYPTMSPCPDTGAGLSYYEGNARDYTINILSGVSSVIDSFTVATSTSCIGPNLLVRMNSYIAGWTVRTNFGDGTFDTSTIIPIAAIGYVMINHGYSSSGIYTIKQVLYNGATPIDSIVQTYHHTYCFAKNIDVFLDANGNCIKDSFERNNFQTMTIEVDSNGVPIDTLSVTSGLYYAGTGPVGSVYRYRIISTPVGFYVACPSTGIITDTVTTGGLRPNASFGLTCSSTTSFDLAVRNVISYTRVNRQAGTIYVCNNYCAPVGATVTLHFSPKYWFTSGDAYPTPSSTTATSITWSLSSVSGGAYNRVRLSYMLDSVTTFLSMGDTVHTFVTISPYSGDADTTNNEQTDIDTVTSAYDPNEIIVKPEGNILAGTQLKYTIHFENTGNDTAFNIHVMDTLSDNVDVSSFTLVDASAAMYVTKLHDSAGHNILKFDFPNINLPDSSHPFLCHGMLMYTINTKKGLPDGALVPNRVGIYFDYNSVIMTNEVTNVIKFPAINVSELHSGVICLGDTAYFNATSPNITNTHYRWLLNGTPVGGDNIAYNLAAPVSGDAVKCLLWDGIGDSLLSTSAASVLTVNNCATQVSSDVSDKNRLNIYPNPSHGSVTISIPNNSVAANIVIMDLFGKVVREIETVNTPTIDIQNLAKGTYIIKLTSAGTTYRDKIVIW